MRINSRLVSKADSWWQILYVFQIAQLVNYFRKIHSNIYAVLLDTAGVYHSSRTITDNGKYFRGNDVSLFCKIHYKEFLEEYICMYGPNKTIFLFTILNTPRPLFFVWLLRRFFFLARRKWKNFLLHLSYELLIQWPIYQNANTAARQFSFS